ncbi:UNVERIFIED_CONTAM: hypothetical protein Sindi_1430600, partial [Sesamum indicum]
SQEQVTMEGEVAFLKPLSWLRKATVTVAGERRRKGGVKKGNKILREEERHSVGASEVR